MSYILDALRRADSERDRGAVPGLHTQAVPTNVGDAETERRPRPGLWFIAAVFLALLGMVAWLLMERMASPDLARAAIPASPPAAVVAAPSALEPASATASIPTKELAAKPASAPAAPPPETAANAAKKPAPSTRQTAQGRAAETRRAVEPSETRTTARAAAKPSLPASAAGQDTEPPPRIYALNELPEEIRRALPATPVSGSVYSKNAANRMLVISGQVFHEGDELAPQLVLEQIRQKAAVLRFKGFRYQITYQ